MAHRTCLAEGCERIAHARGLCSMHYQRLRNSGRLEPATAEERFWSKVDRRGPDECWLWTGAVSDNGYGRCSAPSTSSAHRFSYELAHGPIPEGLTIDHVCHNRDLACGGGPTDPHRRCVNPGHLAAVTQRENTLASKNTTTAKHAAVTHCPQGHPYDEANTVMYRGMRRCRECRRQHLRSWRERTSDEPRSPCRTCGRPSRQGGHECSGCSMRRLRAERKDR